MANLIVDPYDLFGSSSINYNYYGRKATSLLEIKDYTPKFILISTELYHSYLNEDENKFNHQFKKIKHYITEKFDDEASLIIRSSATRENLNKRGKYISVELNSLNDFKKSILNIFEDFDKHKEVEEEIGLIIQKKIDFLVKGHFSNERRISKKSTSWMYEIEESKITTRLPLNQNLFIKKNRKIEIDLKCEKFDDIIGSFEGIAQKFISPDYRIHFEWLYEEGNLFLVQYDIENKELGQPPTSSWNPLTNPEKNNYDFKLLNRNYSLCKKTKCLLTFQKCDLPHAKVYILNDEELFNKVLKNEKCDDLELDLKNLISYPIVIRTDVNIEGENFLLPRTDTIFKVEEAQTFITKTLQDFSEHQIPLEDIFFLFHRYISSKASALSFTTNETPNVKIDSIWGLPDGLHCFPYDSYELSFYPKETIESKISCKPYFLDCNKEGQWVKRKSGWKYDWMPSLTEIQVKEIAEMAQKISAYLKSAVAIMYFIDVDEKSGHPSVLPWYYTTDIPLSFDSKPVELIFPSNIFTLKSKNDFPKLKALGKNEVIVKLQLNPEIIRDRDFINSVADYLSKEKISTVLEGSLLSHLFYILTSKGTNLKCTDTFRPTYEKVSYNKLVRDKIPKKISKQGEKVSIKKISEYEHIELLKQKLVEEALELNEERDTNKLIEEAADVYEVVITLLDKLNFNWNDLLEVVHRKRKKSGGFSEGIYLIKTQDLPLIEKGRESLLHYESKVDYSKTEVVKMQETKNILSLEVPLVPPLSKVITKKSKDKIVRIKYQNGVMSINIEKVTIDQNIKQPTLFDKLPLISDDDE